MGAMLTPMSGHTLFSYFKTKSSQHVLLRVSLSSGRSHSCGCSVRGQRPPGSWGSTVLCWQWRNASALCLSSQPFPCPLPVEPQSPLHPTSNFLCLFSLNAFLSVCQIDFSLPPQFFPQFCFSWIFIDSALYSLLHAGQVNWLHGSSVNLWYRYHLYMLLLVSVHIFNFSRANMYTVSYSASTSSAAFLHFPSVENSLFCHTSVLMSLLVFLNHEQSCMCKRFFSRTQWPFQVHSVFPSCLLQYPTYQLLDRLKPVFLKPRVCVLVLVFLSSPQVLRHQYFTVTTAKAAAEYNIHSHFLSVNNSSICVCTAWLIPCPHQEAVLDTLQKLSALLVLCRFVLCRCHKSLSLVKKPKQTGCACRYFLELFK